MNLTYLIHHNFAISSHAWQLLFWGLMNTKIMLDRQYQLSVILLAVDQVIRAIEQRKNEMKMRFFVIGETYQILYKIFNVWWFPSLLLKPGPGPWTRTLKKKRLFYVDPEKHGINIGLKNMCDFRELCFIKTMRNVIYCLKVRVLTDIQTKFFRLKIVLIITQL